MTPIVVIGGGGHAKVVLCLLRKLKSYRIVGYTDLADRGAPMGASYLGGDEALSRLASTEYGLKAVLGVGQIGSGIGRHKIWSRVDSAVDFPTIISPNAVINEGVTLSSGVVAMDGVVVNSGATIGNGTILNTHCTIEHDAVIGDWVHVAPAATVAGGSKIGRYSMLGAGSVVIEGINLVEGCVIGAGATVVDDLGEAGTYVGSPARRIS